MQINLSLSSNIVIGLLLIVVGLIQIYMGSMREVPSFTQSQSDSESLDLSILSTSVQEAKLNASGPEMVKKIDNLQVTSGLLIIIVGVIKGFFNKNQA